MKKYIKIVSLLMLLSLYFNAEAQYTLTDKDVVIKDGFIIELTKEGEKSIKDKSIVIPKTLKGEKIIGISDKPMYSFLIYRKESKGVFARKGLKEVELPSTMEYIGDEAFFNNENLKIPNFQKCKNLKVIGRVAFLNVGGDTIHSNKLDFSNLKHLEEIRVEAFCNFVCSFDTIDFTNCVNLNKISTFSFSYYNNTLKKVILKNCPKLNLIGSYNFFLFFGNHKILVDNFDLSENKSLIYIGERVLSCQTDTTYSYNLPIPKIGNLTFVNWYNKNGKVVNKVDNTMGHYIAKFKELVIYLNFEIENMIEHSYLGSKINPNLNNNTLQSVKQGQNDNKTVSFIIRNHSVQQVNISAIKTTNGGTLSWQKGTIKTGETQTVVVTYPKGTTDYSNTISIEGPDLKGNTTVKISKTGETTTDNNMLSSVAQEQLAREQNKLLSVYPNPALSELHISYSKPQESYRVKIISLQGKTMYQNNRFQGTSVNVEHLPPAIYLIQVNESVKTFIKH